MKPYTFNPQPFLVDKNSAMQGYVTSEPFAIEKAAHFTPKVFLLADEGLAGYSTLIETRRDLVDKKPDLVARFIDASTIGWYNYHLSRQQRRQCADQRAEPGNDRRSVGLFGRRDEEIRHRRFRRRLDARRRRHDRCAHEELFRRDGARRRHQARPRLPQGLHAAIRRQEGRARPAAEDNKMPPATAPRSDPLVALRGVGKTFPNGTLALDGFRSRRARRRIRVAARPVGLRQIDCVAHHRRLERAERGRRRMAVAASAVGQRKPDRLRVPGADADAVDERIQQRAAAAQAQGHSDRESARARRGGARPGRPARNSAAPIRANCRAACACGSRSRARWSPSRRCC